MASWTDFEAADPELAQQVRQAFARAKHCTMATLRSDGAPRISGTEVEFSDGEIFLGMPVDSRKSLDLARDPRVAIHSPTVDPAADGSWAGEAKLSGRVVAAAVPADYPPNSQRYRVDLSSAVFTALTADAKALQIRLWQPGRATQTMLRT